MGILLGCIADDFTGATDLANTLVANGMRTIQVIGVSGWLRMPDSDSSMSPTKRYPLKIVLPFSGKAGQAMEKSSPIASISASATGPIFPSSVESKVEQYLKKICRAPLRCSHSSVFSD